MRFRCERCRAKYRIDDALVAGCVRRIRCQRCTAVMTLRGAQAVGAPDGTLMSGPPPQMSDIAWFARIHGKSRGPYAEDEVVGLFHDGTISAHTLLWHDALGEWQSFIDLEDFAVLFTPRRRLKAKAERPVSDEGTKVVDFMKVTEVVPPIDTSSDLLFSDEDDACEDESDPTDPYDVLERSDIEWVSLSGEGFEAADATKEPASAASRTSTDVAPPPDSDTDPPTSGDALFDAPPLCDIDEAPRAGTDQAIAAVGLNQRRRRLVVVGAGGALLLVGAITLVAALAGGEDKPAAVVEAKRGDATPVAVGWDEVGGDKNAACLVEGACAEEAVDAEPDTRTARAARGGARSDPREAARVRELLAGSRKGPSVVPTVRLEHTLVPDQSALSAEQVQLIVKRGISAVRSCVERQPPGVAPASGRHVLSLSVAVSGVVERARFENGILNASPLGGCVVRAAKRWRFPAFDGEGVELRVPLVLGG